MSNYIKKLEDDYEKGKITKDEFINSTLDYYKNWDTAKYEKLKRDLNFTIIGKAKIRLFSNY